MNELMLTEMQSQAEMLAGAITDLRDQASRIDLDPPESIVLTGSGDSGYAAIAVEDLLSRRLGVPVTALPSMAAARYAVHSPGELTVAISVSGEVIRTLEAARAAREMRSATVAVVANGASSLARTCKAALVMPKPITRATPHTRDYTATLLALAVLGEKLQREQWPALEAWVRDIGQLVDASLTWSAQLSVPGPDTRVWFLGSGPDRGTAAYGALKFWEGGAQLSWWDDLEEFAHGSQLQARPGDDVVLFATGRAHSRALEMIAGLLRMELRVYVVTDGETSSDIPAQQQIQLPAHQDPLMVGFYSCIPIQAMTYAYACARKIDVLVPMGGAPFGQTYEDVHNEWMRKSKLEAPAQT